MRTAAKLLVVAIEPAALNSDPVVCRIVECITYLAEKLESCASAHEQTCTNATVKSAQALLAKSWRERSNFGKKGSTYWSDRTGQQEPTTGLDMHLWMRRPCPVPSSRVTIGSHHHNNCRAIVSVLGQRRRHGWRRPGPHGFATHGVSSPQSGSLALPIPREDMPRRCGPLHQGQQQRFLHTTSSRERGDGRSSTARK